MGNGGESRQIMIRHFLLSDLDRILEIEELAFPKSPYHESTFLYLSWLYPDTFWIYVGPARDRQEEEIWGYLIFSKEGHLVSLAVHPRYRRRGVGRDLITKAIGMFSFKNISAEVRRSNLGALAFYQKTGFQMVGVIQNYYGNEDALIVQWTPPSPSNGL